MTRGLALLLSPIWLLAACDGSKPLIQREPKDAGPFPAADRPVASIVSARWSNEEARDRLNEAGEVMTKADIRKGMTVADIGAGEGYYTIRLAARVGEDGRVLAEDVMPAVRDQLAERVSRERLDNVSVRLGEPADPKLPPGGLDRIFMVHMYHEVTDPYAFLWHLVGGLKPGGEVIVVDADRPVKRHGIPPARLKCELAALGLRLDRFERMPDGDTFFAAFRAAGPRPAPAAIKPCAEPA